MRGWVYSLVDWISELDLPAPGPMVIQEFEGDIDMATFAQDMTAKLNLFLLADKYPRLQAYLEGQVGAATITPFAVFRD